MIKYFYEFLMFVGWVAMTSFPNHWQFGLGALILYGFKFLDSQ